MPPLIRAEGSLLSKITWDEDESPEDNSYHYEDFGGLTQSTKYETGEADGQINDIYHDVLTLAPGVITAIRLDQIAAQLFDRDFVKSLQRINAFQIHNLSLISDIFLDQSVPDPLDFLPLSAKIPPGGVFQLDGQYDIVLPNDGIGLRNPSSDPVSIHLTVLGVFDA